MNEPQDFDHDDDFARFRAERLAQRRASRPAPNSGEPFFGTDRYEKRKTHDAVGEALGSLDEVQPAAKPQPQVAPRQATPGQPSPGPAPQRPRAQRPAPPAIRGPPASPAA